MAFIKVYHVADPDFRAAKTPEEARKQFRGALAVAKLWTDDLDLAYRLTNNIDEPWPAALTSTASPVKAIVAPGRHRSTSVGDFMTLDNGREEIDYQVANYGFNEIGRAAV